MLVKSVKLFTLSFSLRVINSKHVVVPQQHHTIVPCLFLEKWSPIHKHEPLAQPNGKKMLGHQNKEASIEEAVEMTVLHNKTAPSLFPAQCV